VPISAVCPQGHKLNVPSRYAGRRVRCPACQTKFVIPESERGSASSPPAEAEEAAASDSPSQKARSLPATAASATGPPTEEKWHSEFQRRRAVRRMAGLLAILAGASLLPVLAMVGAEDYPGWWSSALLVGLLLLAYSVWLALTPDYSALWVAMFAAAGFAAAYAAGTAVNIFIEPGYTGLLGWPQLKRTHGHLPTLWCAAIAVASTGVAYLCGRASRRWHQAVQDARKQG